MYIYVFYLLGWVGLGWLGLDHSIEVAYGKFSFGARWEMSASNGIFRLKATLLKWRETLGSDGAISCDLLLFPLAATGVGAP